MGTFNKMSMGLGVLAIDGVDSGFLDKAVEFAVTRDLADFKTTQGSLPQALVGSMTRDFGASITAKQAEIFNTVAWQNALGGFAPTEIAGTVVNMTAAWHVHTFAYSAASPGVQFFDLAGPNISTGGDAPVIKDLTEVTTYTEDTDYIVDYDLGRVYLNPAAPGTIPASSSVKVKYKYTPPASHRFELGHSVTIPTVALTFTHTNPQTAKTITVYFPKARVKGQIKANFSTTEFAMLDIAIDSLYDSTYSVGGVTAPFGYVLIED